MPNVKTVLGFLAGISLVLLVWWMLGLDTKNNDAATASTDGREVQILTLQKNEADLTPLTLNGTIVSAADVEVLAEASGKITTVHVAKDQVVAKGAALITLENADQRIAVARAQSALVAQQAALDNLLLEANKDSGSTVGAVAGQLETARKNAYVNFLNTDLRAYSTGTYYNKDKTVELPSPVITGSYDGATEGVYRIEFYGSNAESGISARVSGIETLTSAMTVLQPSPLGTKGLLVQLPAGVAASDYVNTYWEVPIPNTRSGGYQAAKAGYEATLAGSAVTTSQTEVRPQQIEQMKRAVEQARLSLASAQVALGRTIVRAPISGTITSFDLDEGDFIGAGSPVATVKNLDDLEGKVFITEQDRLFVQPGNHAVADGTIKGYVSRVATVVDKATQKVEVRLTADADESKKYKDTYTEGQTVSISIDRTLSEGSKRAELYDNQFVIPLTAIQIIGTTPYVFSVAGDNTAHAHAVKTGLLLGEDVVITEGLTDVSAVIIDSRGLTDGIPVTVL